MVKTKKFSVSDAGKRLFSCEKKSLIAVHKTRNHKCTFEMDCRKADEAVGKPGYFVLRSIYRSKDGVERVFNSVKHDIGFDRPEVKTDATLEGKVFIGMVAGMLSTIMRNALRAHRERLTYRTVLKELECRYTFNFRNTLQWGEISEKQSMILRCLGCSPAEVKAKLVKKRGPEPKSRQDFALHERIWGV